MIDIYPKGTQETIGYNSKEWDVINLNKMKTYYKTLDLHQCEYYIQCHSV